MDTTKWKSTLLPREVYEELVVIARVEGRTISGQLRYIHEQWKMQNLSLETPGSTLRIRVGWFY